MELMEKVRELLKSRGMTQAELARRLGVDPNRITRWLDSIGLPSAYQAHEIAGIFDVDLRWLCDRTLGMDDPHSASPPPIDSWFELTIRRLGPEEAQRRLLDSSGAPAPARPHGSVDTTPPKDITYGQPTRKPPSPAREP